MGQKRRFEFLTNISGQNEKDGVFRLTPTSAELIQNMHYTKDGTFSAYLQGYAIFSDEIETGADIDALAAFKDESGSETMLVNANGTVHDVSFSGGTDNGSIASGFTVGTPVDFQTFKGSVYMVDGSVTPQVWTGTGSASSISSLPKVVGGDTYDKPKIVEKFNNRLVYGNFQDTTSGPYPSHISISDTLAPDSITTTSTNATDGAVLEISPGDGQSLTALKALYIPEQNEEVLVCFKDKSTYIVYGSIPTLFSVQLVSDGYGCLNNRFVVQVGNDLIFGNDHNIYSLSTATQNGNLKTRVLGSDRVASTLARLNLSATEKAWAVHLPDRFEVWFAFPTGSSTEVDTILVYNYRNAEQGENIWTVRKNMTARCGLHYDRYFYTGGTDGYVDQWFTVSTYRGTGYNWVYRYPYFNFRDQTRTKRIFNAFAIFSFRGSQAVTLKSTWKLGGNNTSQSYSKSEEFEAGSTYGTAVYNGSYYSLGEGELVHEQFQVLGNGLMWQFETSGTTNTVGPDFLGVYGHLEIGDFNRIAR
jgi:uncharacterized protein YbaR (Trm112 family)